MELWINFVLLSVYPWIDQVRVFNLMMRKIENSYFSYLHYLTSKPVLQWNQLRKMNLAYYDDFKWWRIHMKNTYFAAPLNIYRIWMNQKAFTTYFVSTVCPQKVIYAPRKSCTPPESHKRPQKVIYASSKSVLALKIIPRE